MNPSPYSPAILWPANADSDPIVQAMWITAKGVLAAGVLTWAGLTIIKAVLGASTANEVAEIVAPV